MGKEKEGVPPNEDELLEDVVVPEDDDAAGAAPKNIDLDEEEKVEKEFKGLDNKAFAALRKEAADAKREREALKKKVTEYEQRMAEAEKRQAAPAPIPPILPGRQMYNGVPVPQSREEWDALARKDWKLAVDMSTHVENEKAFAKYTQQQKAAIAQEESKQRVLQKHPELGDANSEKSKIFLQVLDSNPDYLTMVKGPILAMRDMEDMLEAQGKVLSEKKVPARSEGERVVRAELTGGGRMPEKQGRTVQLTKDDLEFCKSQELDPKEYAKYKFERENNQRGAQL